MSDQDFEALCVGILVADMFSSPLTALPTPGEIVVVEELLLDTGGCAANTSVSLSKLGAKTAVIGKVGDDVFADFIRQDLGRKHVDGSGIRQSPCAPTSRTVILPVKGEDRRYVHAIGANADLRLEDIDMTLVTRSRVVYVGGYLALPGFEPTALARLFAFARQHGIITVLDLAGVHAGHSLDLLEPALPYTDVFLPNDDEARLLTGEDDPLRQAEIFVECGAGTAVITLGRDGVVVKTRDHALRASAYQIDVVDPSGAGDAFDAGFIIGLLEGWDLRPTIEFASATGASACTRLGCTTGVFTRDAAIEFMGEHRIECVEVG